MFKSSMTKLGLDTKRMPLGKISTTQVAKARAVLGKLKAAIDSGNRSGMTSHSSTFYTLVPHAFSRSQRPPVLSSHEAVTQKMQMLDVLDDIQSAQAALKKAAKAEQSAKEELVPHPLDVKFNGLDIDMEALDKSSDDYKLLAKYFNNTLASNRFKIADIFAVSRHSADERFAQHDALGERHLLFHSTNVAVVAAILKSGLRIMPSAGGRVGKSLYHASMAQKSAQYIRTAPDGEGFFFLDEVVMGRTSELLADDWSLRAPPSGYDSIRAMGTIEPDPKDDVVLDLDGHSVRVPAGKPKSTKYSSSRFHHSEYCVFDETRVRIRYLIKVCRK
ncbi:poly polymerase family [Thecamonas trahens ATCC 50062]|uniref:Poly [ADP-ribose] polymerase n=1 Tax=Thecamonas trahens ATCC 50062 TaxID=461836 RepID=A0A0L0D6A2_THETB|nr:poly polymerase family [Thecamonas trahens ATCC 50062]KNC47884.1 poly polymerase family [Thecamonas trahens ATCC 50062]|eukprot:XP_013759362.1 poly polymerase family [Thecamonas trahens ATCC 50062]